MSNKPPPLYTKVDKAGLQGQTRLVCKVKQGWFASANKAGLQIQTRLVCEFKQGRFTGPNKAYFPGFGKALCVCAPIKGMRFLGCLTLRARAARLRRENAKKAKAAANKLFPGEKWIKAEDGIYLSPRRAVGKKSNYEHELRDARILRDMGSTIYFVPESSRQEGKKYDAIVNGLQFEFKNAGGNANTLITQFLRSRLQAPNVFINLEASNLTRHEIISALYGARNSVTHTDRKGNIIKGYADSNRFSGGRIILKIRGQDDLIYLNVDNLKIPGQ